MGGAALGWGANATNGTKKGAGTLPGIGSEAGAARSRSTRGAGFSTTPAAGAIAKGGASTASGVAKASGRTAGVAAGCGGWTSAEAYRGAAGEAPALDGGFTTAIAAITASAAGAGGSASFAGSGAGVRAALI
jgi:hypothetical protein